MMDDLSDRNRRVNSTFIECIKSFAMNETIHQLDAEELFIANNGSYSINYEHPIFSGKFYQAEWSIELLGKEFLNYYVENEGDSEERIKHIRRSMAIRLISNFEESLYGVDADVISAIAAERYESAEGKGLAISFIPYPLSVKWFEEHAQEGTVTFAIEARTQFCFANVHRLRKQLNMADGGSLAVCYLKDQEIPFGQPRGLYSIGIIPAEEIASFPYIYFSGHAEWNYCVPVECKEELKREPALSKRRGDNIKALSTDRCRLSYKNGRLQVPKINFASYYFHILEDKGIEPADGERVINLIEKAMEQKNGTVLIVSDARYLGRESKRLCSGFRRGIQLQKPVNVLNNPDILKQITSIDGAVFIDYLGNCYACGVILDGSAKKQGDIGRGARYNSTKIYLDNKRARLNVYKILGIVVSEDGMVNIL